MCTPDKWPIPQSENRAHTIIACRRLLPTSAQARPRLVARVSGPDDRRPPLDPEDSIASERLQAIGVAGERMQSLLHPKGCQQRKLNKIQRNPGRCLVLGPTTPPPETQWPCGKIDGPGKWNKPHLNQCHLFLTKLSQKRSQPHFIRSLRVCLYLFRCAWTLKLPDENRSSPKRPLGEGGQWKTRTGPEAWDTPPVNLRLGVLKPWLCPKSIEWEPPELQSERQGAGYMVKWKIHLTNGAASRIGASEYRGDELQVKTYTRSEQFPAFASKMVLMAGLTISLLKAGPRKEGPGFKLRGPTS